LAQPACYARSARPRSGRATNCKGDAPIRGCSRDRHRTLRRHRRGGVRISAAAAIVALGLLAPLVAHGAPSNVYTAAGSPAAVKPSSTASYTIALANDPNSPDSARWARISFPSEFDDPSQIDAKTSAADKCRAADWTVEWNSSTDRLYATWPGREANELCPGGVLTVTFRATAPATEKLYTWVTHLLRGATEFALNGSQPTVRVDGTPPPAPSIASGPPSPTNQRSASFVFSGSASDLAFSCKVDGGDFSACASPVTYTGLSDGAHAFRVRATDAAGNTGDASAYTWTVDTTAPAVPTRVDQTPPGNVRNVAKSVRYRLLQLRWESPADEDFDHVVVVVGKSPNRPPSTPVYQGTRTSYTDAKFRNGFYYRYAITSYDRAGNASRRVAVVVPASALLTSPRVGARLRGPPLLDWASVPKATYYNVQLYRGSRKVLSAWPSRSKLKLRRSWSYQDGVNRLKKGTYRWYVWPGFGRRSQVRYGHLLGQANFVVTG
jgi:hypothetical protein